MFASPDLVQPAYAVMLEPLIEQLQRGLEHGEFHDIDPVTAAQLIRAWCGRAPNGNGPQVIAIALTLATYSRFWLARDRRGPSTDR